jgi:hypothetical protein
MAMWSCPHCGTPQEETARCWVCRRSTVSCATCRHVRSAVVGDLLFCGLDRERHPLRGDEVRPCWAAAATNPHPNVRSIPAWRAIPIERDLVPVMDEGAQVEPSLAAATSDGWTLFGDAELDADRIDPAAPNREVR